MSCGCIAFSFEFAVCGLRVGVEGLGFRVPDLGFGCWGSRMRVKS